MDIDCYDLADCPDGDCENCSLTPAGAMWPRDQLKRLHEWILAEKDRAAGEGASDAVHALRYVLVEMQELGLIDVTGS